MEIYVIIDNTLITSVNVSEFYRIFTFRFSFCPAPFDTQLMNFIWKYVFLIIQDKFTAQLHRGSLKYRFYFENSRSFKSV